MRKKQKLSKDLAVLESVDSSGQDSEVDQNGGRCFWIPIKSYHAANVWVYYCQRSPNCNVVSYC